VQLPAEIALHPQVSKQPAGIGRHSKVPLGAMPALGAPQQVHVALQYEPGPHVFDPHGTLIAEPQPNSVKATRSIVKRMRDRQQSPCPPRPAANERTQVAVDRLPVNF
jgi:hypothetical protein